MMREKDAYQMMNELEENGVDMKEELKEAAKEIGKIIAQRALDKGIKAVVFDRGGYLYHGRVAELAAGAREGGLQF